MLLLLLRLREESNPLHEELPVIQPLRNLSRGRIFVEAFFLLGWKAALSCFWLASICQTLLVQSYKHLLQVVCYKRKFQHRDSIN